MDRLRFVCSFLGKADLVLELPKLSTPEEVDDVETLFRIIIGAQRRGLEAHTGAPGKIRETETRDEPE